MRPRCPYCRSQQIDETGKFDLQYVEPDEVAHDFECLDCEGLFQIVYAPIAVKPIESREEQEDAEAPELMPRAHVIRRRAKGT